MWKIVGVIGAGDADERLYTLAEEVGRQLAARGALLVCGGLGGVMEAAAKGARSQGGTTLGILPGDDPHDANPFISVPVATGFGEGRNVVVARTAGALIAVGGAYGTLSEIAFGLRQGKPVIGLQSWRIDGMQLAQTAVEAVEMAWEAKGWC